MYTNLDEIWPGTTDDVSSVGYFRNLRSYRVIDTYTQDFLKRLFFKLKIVRFSILIHLDLFKIYHPSMIIFIHMYIYIFIV